MKSTALQHDPKMIASPPARGAWIEIDEKRAWAVELARRPPRGGRGLKYPFTVCFPGPSRRPPRGGRGLKLKADVHHFFASMSPPARGAWIEIISI